MRQHWTDLPAVLRRTVEAECGPVRLAGFAATLHADSGPVFAKGSRSMTGWCGCCATKSGSPVFGAAPPRHLTVFAAALASLWSERARRSPAPHRPPLAAAARWARWRTDQVAARTAKMTL